MVVNGALCALTNLPQLYKESTTCKLWHIDAVTVKSHLLFLVEKDITRSILVGSDLKMVTFLPHQQYNTRGCSKDYASY